MPPTRTEHENYLGSLRFLLAFLVLWGHCYPLQGLPHDPLARLTHGSLTLGILAVDTFFLISGYLITQSWFNSSSANRFVMKRIARIYPGYWVALIFSLLVGALFSGPNWADYLWRASPHGDNLLKAVLFFQYGVLDSPYSFLSNPCPHAVNGSLWTLQPEVSCYLLVLAFGSCLLLRRGYALIALVVCLLCIDVNLNLYGHAEHRHWRFLAMFIGGSLFYLYRGHPLLARPWLIALSVAILGLSFYYPFLYLLTYPVCGGHVLFSFAFTRPPNFLVWKSDLSYGLYIYAFPAQQMCVAILHLTQSPALLLTVSAPVALLLAWLSWRYVEQPMISLAAKGRSATDLAHANQSPNAACKPGTLAHASVSSTV